MHELASKAARVLVANFVDLNGVIATIEGDEELSVLIIRLSGDELGVEPQDVHVLLEHLLHVSLGGLRLQGLHATHGVSLVSIPIIDGYSLVLHGSGGRGELHGHLSLAKLLLVPLLGELIAVEDHAVATVDLDGLAASDVSGTVVVLLLERHAGAVGVNWRLGQLLSLQQLGERSSSRVGCVDLLHLHRVVGQEVVQRVELVTAIVGHIIPEDFEAKNTSIIVKEALKAIVRTATLELDFDVVFELSLVRRGLLHVNHLARAVEQVLGVALGLSDVAALVRIVAAGEVVAVHDAELTRVNIDVHTEAEIRPVIVTRAVRFLEFGALQENALGNSRVLNARLNDVERVIVQVEVDNALPKAEVLLRALNGRLEEVGVEFESL